MKLLREYVRSTLQRLTEAPGSRSGFHDSWFLDELPSIISSDDTSGFNPELVGQKIGHGNEAVIFSYGDDKVIRFQPSYDLFIEDVDDAWTQFHAKSERLGAIDDGRLTDHLAVSEASPEVPFAFWRIMPRYVHLSSDEKSTIENVVMGSMDVSDVQNVRLKTFLAKYVNSDDDISDENVMKDEQGNYVIIDL